jgi:phage-related protein
VNVAKYQVILFEKENGEVPVEDFINSLDIKMSAKIYRVLEMVSENGPELRKPYSEHLDDGIFELRAKFGSNITRVLYFFFTGRRVVVTNGFIKKTQKTPKSVIDKAKAYRNEYKMREEHNNENP